MVKKIKDVQSPRGLARLLWRAPIWLYRLGLGRLLGGRLLLLRHTGRKSGQIRKAVLEVVRHDEETGVFIVASGFGEKANWYKNVTANPQAIIQVGNQQMAVRVERLSFPQAAKELLGYNQRHPGMLKSLAGILGYQTDGSESDIRFFASVIPIMAFIPEERH